MAQSVMELGMGFLTIAIVSVGAAYSFTRAATANLREKDDHWNATIGGFVGGAVGGLKRKFIFYSSIQTSLQFEHIFHLNSLVNYQVEAFLY